MFTSFKILLYIVAIVLQVFNTRGAMNIALLKPTKQGSTYIKASSSRAVDGNTDRYFDHYSCTHTVDHRPDDWWCVDLQKVTNITSIKLINRLSFMERLQGFDLLLSSTGLCSATSLAHAALCYKDRQTTPQTHYVIDRCDQLTGTSLSGRFVYVRVHGPNAVLTLCEVEVYEACKFGFYGDHCYSRCPGNCRLGSCEDVTGKCMGCKVGYYGDRCDETCGTCNGTCRQLDGICKTGCREGYWGPNGLCLETCSYCTTEGCRVEDGVCYNGCKNGTQHPKCTSNCGA